MLELHALGRLTLRGAESVQPKRLALLCYLTLAGTRSFHRRDSLVALFWPELDEPHARQSLRQALTAIRALDEHLIVTRSDEEVGIAPGALACDVLAFEQALAQGDLVAALERHTGPFLDGFFLDDCPEFERWVESERARLSGLAADAAWKLAEREQVPAAAVQWARRAAGFQRDDEVALRRLITVLDRAGDRAGALREYEAFARRLREQYQAAAAPETQALVARVRGRSEPGPVSTVAPAERPQRSSAGVVEPLVRTVGPTGTRWPIYAVGTLVVSILLAGTFAPWRGRSTSSRGEGKVRSIAVLPFADVSPQEREPYFADGMTEALITELGRIGAFDKVISRASVMRYTGVSKPAPEIARDLGVDALVEASFAKAGGRVRVTVQLIQGTTERSLWAESYERDLRDILGLQGDLARDIAEAVALQLKIPAKSRTDKAAVVNPAAYDAYLRGSYHLNRHQAGDRIRALAELQQAVQLDSLFAGAQARLAQAYAYLGYFGYPGAPPAPQAFAAANAAVARALALDSSLSDAYVALARIRWTHDPDLAAAESAARRAVELNPANADAHFELGRLLGIEGRGDSAIREVERALELDPLNAVRHADLAWTYMLVGRYEQAIKRSWEVVSLDSTEPESYLALGNAYLAQGKYQEAVAALETGYRQGQNRTFLGVLGFAYARAGRAGDARRVLEELHGLYREHLGSSYYVAWVYFGLDQRDSALTWLETASREGDGHLVFVAPHPVWGPLRSEPRFQALMKKVGLP